MNKLKGRLLKLETGHVVLVKEVVEKNELPPTDWIVDGEPLPTDLKHWDGGAEVFGFDLTVEFEDGSTHEAWCAEGDWMLKFYDIAAVRTKTGHYALIFSDQAFMSEDGKPGLPVGLLELPAPEEL